MYFLAVIATLVILSLFTFFGAGWERVIYFIDMPSLLLTVLISIPILVASGLHKDFLSAFRLTFSSHCDVSLRKKKRARAAVCLTMKTLLLSGGLVTVYSLVLIFAEAGMGTVAGNHVFSNLSVSIIPLLYALLLDLFLLLLYGKLNTMIIEHTDH